MDVRQAQEFNDAINPPMPEVETLNVMPHRLSSGLKVGTVGNGLASLDVVYPSFLQGSERRASRYLQNLYVDPANRRQSGATMLMQSICAQADRERLALFVIPGTYRDGEMTTEALGDWYARRFGFMTVQRNAAAWIMVRLAGAVQVAREQTPDGLVIMKHGTA